MLSALTPRCSLAVHHELFQRVGEVVAVEILLSNVVVRVFQTRGFLPSSLRNTTLRYLHSLHGKETTLLHRMWVYKVLL